MPMATRPDTTISTRRAMLTGAPAAAAAALATGAAINGLATAVSSPSGADPIYAVIATHRAAAEIHVRAIHAEGKLPYGPEYDAAEAATSEAFDRSYDLLCEVLHTQPTTLAGVAALLAYVGLPEFGEEDEHPSCRETFLTTFNDLCDSKSKRVAQDFPTRLAETVRGLIGEVRS